MIRIHSCIWIRKKIEKRKDSNALLVMMSTKMEKETLASDPPNKENPQIEGPLFMMNPKCYSVFKIPVTNEKTSAHHLVDKNCKEYYFIAREQYTVPQNDNHTYDTILSEKGKELYQLVLDKVAKNEFKDHFTNYVFQKVSSGGWVNDESSPFYDKEYCGYSMNTFDNIVINGYWKSRGKDSYQNGKTSQTSPIIFYTDSWCYTESGSLYSLGDKGL
jgi:hypothetical protein